MSIYRKSYTDRQGVKRKAKRFTAEFVFRGKVYRESGFVDKDSARHWLAEESNKLRRGAKGYVKPMLAKPVMPLIDQFIEYLHGKGDDDMYCYVAEIRLKRLAGEAGWLTIAHVTADSIDQWKAADSFWKGREKPISNRTKNQFIDIARQFGAWLVKAAAVLPTNPLADVERLRAKHNDGYRRAATEDELNRILALCDAARRLYYICRIYVPMRGNTYANLTWSMAKLDASPPFFQTPKEINKSRKDEKHAIRYEIAQELRAAKKREKAKTDDLVFPDPPTLDDFRDDLAKAQVPFEYGKGNRRLDYHAFRRTLIKLAKKSGISRDDASLLLGHRDPRTTAKYYDDDSVNPDLGSMVERLPIIGRLRKAE